MAGSVAGLGRGRQTIGPARRRGRWPGQWSVRSESSRATYSMAVSRSASALATRSEEHTSELQSLMRISYAVFCLKKKKINKMNKNNKYSTIKKQNTNLSITQSD